MRRAAPATLLLVLLLPAAAGCLDFLGKPPGPPPPSPEDRLVKAAFLIPQLDLRIDSPYGYFHINGSQVLAVPVLAKGTESGAVYIGSTLAWRADEVFQVQQRENLRSDMFVQAPAGQWAQVKGQQGWQPADAAALARHGLADTQAAVRAASMVLTANDTAAKPATWLLNGTAGGQVDALSFTVATEVGPLIVQRNATSVTVVHNRTVVSWNSLNRTIVAQNDAGAQIQADPEVDWMSDLRASWDNTHVNVVLYTGPFRKDDVASDISALGRIASIHLPQAGNLGMIKYANYTIEDNRIEVHSQNMSFAILTR